MVATARARLLIVDSRALVRAGLRALLLAEAGLDLVAEAATAADAVAAARLARPDLVLLATRLPDQDGAETCRRLLDLSPRPAVLMLSDGVDHGSVRDCVRAGARGYLLSDVSEDELRRSLRAAARGERPFDHRLGPLLSLEREPEAAAAPETLLSGRRRAILRLVTEGLSNREIAQRTHLSELTVKGYVEEILEALGARNRAQAAVLGIRHGLI